MPLRIFTVTGTPYGDAASTAAVMIARNRSRFHGRTAPPPRRVTLGTGQPKLRSTWSARSSEAMRRTAAPTVAGSTPYTWTDRGRSSGSCEMIRIDSSPRSTRARDVTISATYSPAPDSRHRRRNAALVTPAMGARTTGVSMVRGPMRNGGSTAPERAGTAGVVRVMPPLSPTAGSAQQPAVLLRQPGGLGARAPAGLAHGRRQVVAHRPLRQEGLAGDVGDGPAGRRDDEHGALALGQRVGADRQGLHREVRVDHAQPAVHAADGVGQLLRRGVLDDEPAGP